ncbi:HD domain-containing protein [Enterovirga aerilata]|uniref:HD domain-containing protein n=1 Tax=Enterovirga aerilata TaxID=2730920 RepID=A0A849I9X7_9HYPH|nr:HD domain-containing protein [Enterovirga sp. DB1703]NNM74198.1 HD domain-containing protein [Enterovirga sp. DB1703]
MSSQIEGLVATWLASLSERLKRNVEFRPKQVNDPVWGTIELLPWEVGILDTPLLQRMRGVKQLGLAQLVFPGACHGRLEHIIGVVGAVEEALRALGRQIDRWNRDNPSGLLAPVEEKDRYALRLAALLHDIGHGPFSHALEPVLEVEAPLLIEGGSLDAAWRREIRAVQGELRRSYQLNGLPAASEVLAVMMVLTNAMEAALGNDKLFPARSRPVGELLDIIVAAIIGGVEGPGVLPFSALISSQIDADKMDYLARDAHHAGLEIGFDTSRLLARLEVLIVQEKSLDASESALRERAARSPEGRFLQLGIAASGFGSFEQMLIGRTFLYDRLYHHHKVRAAEAMAQRLILVAERDRKKRFGLDEIFISVDDNTILQIFADEVTHKGLNLGPSPKSASLARGILDRNLLHRAFAFRGRFIASPPGVKDTTADANRQALWARIVKSLDTVAGRYALGEEIYNVALTCANVLQAAGIQGEGMERYRNALETGGPEHILVDLPALKADAIRILARYPNGAIKVPEFSFNPVKWSHAYELQKRTGYVFCAREVVPVVALAAKIVFLSRFGVTMAREADGYIKVSSQVEPSWLQALVNADIIDQAVSDHLSDARHSLMTIRAEDLQVPEGWLQDDQDFAAQLANEIQQRLSGGLTAEHLKALGATLAAMFAFVDQWYAGGRVSRPLADEGELQGHLEQCLRYRGLRVEEGSVVGGGKLDLFVERSMLIENKFEGAVKNPAAAAPAAGMQGRRYAVALDSQVVIVVVGYDAKNVGLPSKPACVTVSDIKRDDRNRAEIRFSLPYGAPVPSRVKPDQA